MPPAISDPVIAEIIGTGIAGAGNDGCGVEQRLAKGQFAQLIVHDDLPRRQDQDYGSQNG